MLEEKEKSGHTSISLSDVVALWTIDDRDGCDICSKILCLWPDACGFVQV